MGAKIQRSRKSTGNESDKLFTAWVVSDWVGPKKLTKNLIYAAYHREGEEALEYKKLQSDEMKKNWQKILEYYDEVLNYSNIFDNMLYKFER